MRHEKRVAVFGGADVGPGSPQYDRAGDLGRLLAGRDITVVTGGYGGVMEASSLGTLQENLLQLKIRVQSAEDAAEAAERLLDDLGESIVAEG